MIALCWSPWQWWRGFSQNGWHATPPTLDPRRLRRYRNGHGYPITDAQYAARRGAASREGIEFVVDADDLDELQPGEHFIFVGDGGRYRKSSRRDSVRESVFGRE